MSKKQIIPCAICSDPQTADIEQFYSILSKATRTPIEEIRSTSYEFVCHNCTNTPTYMTEYFSSKGKLHAVLPQKGAFMFH